jgi:hypothetical protein
MTLSRLLPESTSGCWVPSSVSASPPTIVLRAQPGISLSLGSIAQA